MDHSYIEDRQIVDRYLMRQLPDEEAVRFEDHYVHCQECLDQLELAEKLQQGLKRAVAGDAARVTASRQLGVLAWFARTLRSPRAGLVAMAFLAVALLPAGLLLRDLRRTGHQLEEALRPQVNTGLFSFSPARGAPLSEQDPSHVIRLAADPEWIVLSLELDAIEHESYRVILTCEGHEVWRRGGLRPDHRDSLTLSLHSTWLVAGDYLARVEADAPAGDATPIARFSFRVIGDD